MDPSYVGLVGLRPYHVAINYVLIIIGGCCHCFARILSLWSEKQSLMIAIW